MTDEERLIEINKIIFARGAPLGSEEYFAIREHCAAVLRRNRCTITPTPPVENYWTTGADDNQSDVRNRQITLDEKGEIDSVTVTVRKAKKYQSGARAGQLTLDQKGEPESVTYPKPAVLLHKQQQEQFEQFARKHLRKDGPFLRPCNLIDTPYTYADPNIEAAWEDWKKLK